MKQDSHSKKILITGLNGFTGTYSHNLFAESGFDVVGLASDLTDRESVFSEIAMHSPDYVLHLAAISNVAESNAKEIYNVNVAGSVNVLDALASLDQSLKKVILASSATVYGNVNNSVLAESLCPKPINHYGCSKFAMENMAQNYFQKLPIIISRPFNYTGVGHGENFLIPKIIKAYRERRLSIELGNLDVYREFNDVRDVSRIYLALLMCAESSFTVNICSGRAISLKNIIALMNRIAGYEIEVKVNPAFVRPNEIVSLSGDCTNLAGVISPNFNHSIEDTLLWMYTNA